MGTLQHRILQVHQQQQALLNIGFARAGELAAPVAAIAAALPALQVYAGHLQEKLRAILASGIMVTINSDDPAYFSGYLNANYEYIAEAADLGADDIAKLARNSFAASFISGQHKLQAYAQIREVLAAWKQDQQRQQQKLVEVS
jgi:adenosine deaminase